MNIFKEAPKNKSAFFLIVLGVFIVILSLLSDIFGVGKTGIKPAALLITTIGAALALLGVGLLPRNQEKDQAVPQLSWLTGIRYFPNLLWIVIGFSLAYFIFLILPMFFDPSHKVVYFEEYLYDLHPIGADFLTTLDSSKTWFAAGTAQAFYPPLTMILFAPLTLIGYPGNYYLITIMTVVSYFIAGGLIPFLLAEKANRSVIPFIFGVSIFSYGFQFELERGQFHTIAMLLCILAIYLFHRHPHYRFFAYLLFCISVQLKIYPALLVVMFVDDWRDWKTNLKRFALLGLVNFALLFLLGYSYFSKFITHMLASSVDPHEIWRGNHSITSFLSIFSSPRYQLLDLNLLSWLQKNISLVTYLFLAYFVICFLLVWLNAYRRNTHGLDSFLWMTCVLGGLIIPAVNHDYTLPLLTAPFALIVSERFTQNVPGRMLVILLLLVASFSYTTTLVPFIHKPRHLQDTFPLLIILLTITTLLSFLRDKEEIEPATT
ncbi:MAG TPA: glycosyltransferase family 87 protein [Anaerolineales bacterium]|nr:glycosyltransferase family 87 protein [Anaerolineales bacterium]